MIQIFNGQKKLQVHKKYFCEICLVLKLLMETSENAKMHCAFFKPVSTP